MKWVALVAVGVACVSCGSETSPGPVPVSDAAFDAPAQDAEGGRSQDAGDADTRGDAMSDVPETEAERDVVERDADVDAQDATAPEAAVDTVQKIALPTPPEIQVDYVAPFDAAIVSRRRWISAQTYVIATADHGPMLLWEEDGTGAFVPVSLPETTIAYFPSLCAVSDDEVYTIVLDGVESTGRLFSRTGEPPRGFAEQSLAPPPQGMAYSSLRFSCFAGGNLWVYGSYGIPSDIEHQLPVLLHRAATDDGWTTVDLPSGVGPYRTGIDAALVRPDGTGFYVLPVADRYALFERTPSGWEERFVFDSDVGQVTKLAGEVQGPAIGALLTVSDPTPAKRYLGFDGQRWTVSAAAAFTDTTYAEAYAAARGVTGTLYLAGGVGGVNNIGDPTGRMSASPFASPLDLGIRSLVDVLAVPRDGDVRGIAIAVKGAHPDDNGAFEVQLTTPW